MIEFVLGIIVGLLVAILIVLSLNKEYKEIVIEKTKKVMRGKQKAHIIDTETEEERVNKIITPKSEEPTWLN